MIGTQPILPAFSLKWFPISERSETEIVLSKGVRYSAMGKGFSSASILGIELRNTECFTGVTRTSVLHVIEEAQRNDVGMCFSFLGAISGLKLILQTRRSPSAVFPDRAADVSLIDQF